MKTMVIYDSLYGNTKQIAQAIGDAIAAGGEVAVMPVAEVGSIPAGLDLLVIGGPTQGHGISPTLKAFFDRLPAGQVRGVPVAAFDTRVKWPELLSGSAARGIAKRLNGKGAVVVTEPESFFVEGKEGPLAEGELARAATWTRQLATIFAAAV
jgi:flavodoxin